MIPEVAIANPLVPPSANPRFQPKYMPEMTYPTPNPQSIKGPKVRDNCGGAWEGSGGSFGIGTDFDEDNKKINPRPSHWPAPISALIRIKSPVQLHLQIDDELLRS